MDFGNCILRKLTARICFPANKTFNAQNIANG